MFTIRVGDGACVVRDGESPSPALRMVADPDTWMAMDDGRLLPVDAFTARRLTVSGNADLAVRIQTLFRPFRSRAPSGDLEQVDIEVDGLRLSCYVAGVGDPDGSCSTGSVDTSSPGSRSWPPSPRATASWSPTSRGTGRRTSRPPITRRGTSPRSSAG